MGVAEDDFNFNPFKELKDVSFPKKSVEKSRKVAKTATYEEDDSQLFLNAMTGPLANPAQQTTKGFALSEQCEMPRLEKRKTPQRSLEPSIEAKAEEDADSREFLDAVRSARPLSGKGRDVASEPPIAVALQTRELGMKDFMEGDFEFALHFTDEYCEGHVVGLDDLILSRLRAGQLSPEAHLDLHGLNAMQAFEALKNFMRGAWYKGLRVILLIPGRGKNSPDGQGVLKQKLQLWLTQEPFKRIVLGFCTAQPHDGGPGSLYVLLRKFRKKGRIFWERWPADADLY